MNISQEEALYDFLDDAQGVFELKDVVSYIEQAESEAARLNPAEIRFSSVKLNRLAADVAAFIDLRNLAFPAGNRRWVSRRGCFEPLPFVISPTRLELVNGILIPGHRCVPFANPGLLPQEYTFFWQGSPVPFTSSEGAPEEFYPYYSIFGEEYAPQYVARDNSENEEAFNSDPYEDPPEVSVRTLDMRNIYREISFVPGDRFIARTLDWKRGIFDLTKAGEDEWAEADLRNWLLAAEKGFEDSFRNLGPASSTEEQIAYAYWYGGPGMRAVPAYALEDFLYEKTDRIETAAYGIESRFWYAGREIPDLKGLDTANTRPDKTPVEEILRSLNVPVSEFVIQSYIRDSFFRADTDVNLIIERLVPNGGEIAGRDRDILARYIESVMDDFGESYNHFTDKAAGPLRQRAGELHTAVIGLVFRLNKGDIDPAWLPRHTFIILSQIQSHAAGIMEDLDSDENIPEGELDVIDETLDSMIETYDDIKELIDEAIDSFRRNKLALIRTGNDSASAAGHLVQLSIGGVDIWRRLILPESCTLAELHLIIQEIFGWRNSRPFQFTTEEMFPEKEVPPGGMDTSTTIEVLVAQNTAELLYEYGTEWTVRIMILSRYESPGNKLVRCVTGAGAAPPEFISGPLKFRRLLSSLESGNDMERLGARQKLGPDFVPDDFDIDACNRGLGALFPAKEQERGPEHHRELPEESGYIRLVKRDPPQDR